METTSSIRPLTGEDYKAIWRRRRWWFLGTAALVAAVTCLVVGLWPSSYRSEALILIDQPAVSQEYVKPIIAVDSDQVISGLIQRVLSRSVLGRLDYVKNHGLQVNDVSTNASVTPLRDNSDPRRPAGKPYGLKVSFLGTTPEQAQRVTNELAALVVEEAGKLTLDQAENMTNALRAQLQLAVAKVKDTGEAMAKFRMQYAGKLPIDEQLTIQTLSHLQEQLQVNGQALERTRQNIADLETASQSTSAGQADMSEEKSATLDPSLVRLQTDLQSLKDHLADLESRYKLGHPDLIKTRDQIKRLETEVVEEKNRIASATLSKPAQNSPKVSATTVARSRDNQADLAALMQQRNQLQGQITRYQVNLAAIPSRQQQYSELQREYDAAKKDYETLRDQVTDAEHSTDVYQRLKLVRFRIQDYASRPNSADLPVRWKINLGGLGVALMLGVVLAGIIELQDTSPKSQPDVEFYFRVKCLALIPDFPAPRETQRVRKRNRRWMTASAVTALVLVGLNIYVYLTIVRNVLP
jgi:succinoglycan biosynthesis transport protein ExoP